MNKQTELANRLREVLLDGKWIANTNFKEIISNIDWHEAKKNVLHLNSVAQLTYHVNYYLKGLIHVFEGGDLEIKDQFSFDLPEINSSSAWERMVNEFIEQAEKFIEHVKNMDENQLNKQFFKEDYGSYARNIEAQIEHSYYHLGQISLIKKILSKIN